MPREKVQWILNPPANHWTKFEQTGKKGEAVGCPVCFALCWRIVGKVEENLVGECERCTHFFEATIPSEEVETKSSDKRLVYTVDKRPDLLGYLRLQMLKRSLDSTTLPELVKKMEAWFRSKYPDTPDFVVAEEAEVVFETMRVEGSDHTWQLNQYLKRQGALWATTKWNLGQDGVAGYDVPIWFWLHIPLALGCFLFFWNPYLLSLWIIAVLGHYYAVWSEWLLPPRLDWRVLPRTI